MAKKQTSNINLDIEGYIRRLQRLADQFDTASDAGKYIIYCAIQKDAENLVDSCKFFADVLHSNAVAQTLENVFYEDK
jgi:hypothetical protein